MDWLKKLLESLGLSAENIQKVVEGVEEHYKGWVPKYRFDEVNEARKQAEEAVKERDKQLSELRKSAEGNEELRKQIEELQKKNKEAAEQYEAKIRDMMVTTAIKLTVAGDAHDPDLVASLLDKSKIEVDENGNIKGGLDDQLKALREAKSFLFIQKETTNPLQFKGISPAEGREPSPGGITNPWSKEHFNLTEQGRILKENPELAKQLQAQAK